MVLVQVVVFVLFAAMIFYLLVLTLLAATAKKKVPEENSSPHRFAVVIPAHNEEQGIRSTVESLKALDYPADQFQVVVVADNCTDATAEIARTSGAVVMERREPALRGKGFALRWCFDQILDARPAFDALVVIDADTVADPQFLKVASGYLASGARVIQASDLVSPAAQGWSAQMTRIGFLLYNYVRPLGRKALGGTAGLRGNGMCFRTDVLLEVPWDAYSISEDLEYGLQLLLKGIRVDFAPEAVVHATMPQEARHAESQRARWEGGRLGLIRKYMGPLLKAAVLRPSFACFDAFLDLVTPALVNLVGYTILFTAMSLMLAIFGVGGMWSFAGLWAFLAVLGFVHLFWGLKIARADKSVYQSLAHLPQYALWKLKVYRKMPKHWPGDEWVRTTREKGTNHSDTE